MSETSFNTNKDEVQAPSSKKKQGRPRVVVYNTLWRVLQAIEDDAPSAGKLTLFRGHTSYRHKLRPSLFRTSNDKIRNKEHKILNELIVRHPVDFESDSNIFDHLVRVQHYGLPTRLLDFTSNPLSAIFFAVENDSKEDPEVLAISLNSDNVKYYDSDTVHLLANLARLQATEKDEIEEAKDDHALQNSKAGKRLFDFIAQTRPNFTNRIIRTDLNTPLVVFPKMNNERIRAQNGQFVIFGLEPELQASHGFEIKKYRISKDVAAAVRKSLEKLGVSASTIYPSLQMSAKGIKARYGID